MLHKFRKGLREVAHKQGFVTPSWGNQNPFWKLVVLGGSVTLGWGLNDALVHHSVDGYWHMWVGAIAVIGGSTLIEYLFREEEDEPVAPNAKRPSSGDPSDE